MFMRQVLIKTNTNKKCLNHITTQKNIQAIKLGITSKLRISINTFHFFKMFYNTNIIQNLKQNTFYIGNDCEGDVSKLRQKL